MPKNKIIISLGAFVALLPVLGFPPSWESFFEVIVGLGIIATSVWATIDRKLMQKAKAQKRQMQHRVASSEPESELNQPSSDNNPVF
ncbi:MAG: hypothetical protein AAB690_02145 [Patescibacteria group bacterium]